MTWLAVALIIMTVALTWGLARILLFPERYK